MTNLISRRQLLVAGAAGGALALSPDRGGRAAAEDNPADPPAEPFGYCFNTSTIRGQKLTLPQQIEVVASAGYRGLEPWMGDIQKHVEQGGSLDDVRKQLEDSGVSVESAIGFATWIVDDPAQRASGLEQARRDMDAIRRLGGKRIAAPPVGATRQNDLDLFAAADRYRVLLELGEEMGVLPQLELWGFSASLSRLGEAALVAAETGRPDACLLPDVYHIYKGGSDFAGLRLINGKAIHVFHVNDYPANPPRETIGDADRVYPGDGVAPLGEIFRILYASGFRGMLSLELFNRDYWREDAAVVARLGLEKMRAAVRAVFEQPG